MKQCFTKLILSCLLLTIMVFPAAAYGNGDNTVKVGYIPGYGIVDNLNSLDMKGYGYDILQEASRYGDLEFEFIALAEEDLLPSLTNGTIDMFGPITQTATLATSLDFTRTFGVQQIMLASPASSTLLFNDIDTFNGKEVTVMSSLSFNSYLDSYASSNGIRFTYNNVTNYEDYYNASHQLLLTSSLMNIQDRKVVAYLGLEQMYFATKKGNSSLMTAINSAISAMEVNSPLFMSDTYKKYYSQNNIAKPVLTVDQMYLLQQKSSFSVGYVSNHYPVENVADSGGLPEGIAVDIMNLVAREAGITLTYKPYAAESSADHSQYDINIAWSGLEDFSQYYYASTSFEVSSPLMLVGGEGVKSFPTIGTLPYVTFDLNEVKASYSSSQFVTYNTYSELSKALDKGDVDAVLVSDAIADYIVSIVGDKGYSIYATSHNFPIRIFVSKNLGTDYLNIFNTAINRVDTVEVDKVILSKVSEYRSTTLLDLMAKYWYIYVLGIAMVTGSFFALYLYLQRKKQQAVLDALNIDEITGLASEIKFITDVENFLKTADNDKYMIVTFDIDKFSLIRKQYGYDRSNDVLEKIGEALIDSYPEEAIVARSKADLFLIFTKQNLPGRPVCRNEVIECAQGLLASTHPLSASVGCYRIHDTTVPVQLMIDYSGMARLQGKSVYGLTLNEYTKELDEKRELSNSIVLRMERALLGKELIPYYQPKVHLKTSTITGCEALVRWCDIDSDLKVPKVKYMPDEFIPLFEENGFIAKLDYHIFNEICAFIRRNMKKADLVPKISINLSGITLLKNDLRSNLLGALERYRVSSHDIDLEITESAFTKYPKESAQRVRMLRNEGFTISMDDFGTGASSLNRLKDMDITTIKLDKAFLDYNLAELKGSVIVGNMINMARRLGLEVVAEGVETKEQLSALKMLHCNLVQGYYYSRPVNEDEFVAMLDEPTCLPDAERKKQREQNEANLKAKKEAERGALIE